MQNQVSLTWADLFATGSLIDLDVSMWDGLVRIRPEDLGIPRTDAVRKALTFGHERLVSKVSLQEIRDLAYQGRCVIDNHTLAFDLIPGSRFIPKAHRDSVDEQLKALRVKFNSAVNKFVNNYSDERKNQTKTVREALMQATGGDIDTVNLAMNRIEAQYPLETKLRSKFAIGWRVYSMAAPQDGTGASDGESEGNAIRHSVEQMVDNLRTKLTDKVKAIAELAARGGRITAKTFNSANRVFERLSELNVFGDAGLTATLSNIKNVLNAAQASENSGEALKVLETVSTELAASRDEAINAVSKRIVGMAERKMEL